MGERFIAGSNVRTVTKRASRPAIDVLFSCRRALGGKSLRYSRFRWTQVPRSAVVTLPEVQIKADLKAGSGEAAFGELATSGPSVPRRLLDRSEHRDDRRAPGPVSGTPWTSHPCKAELPSSGRPPSQTLYYELLPSIMGST